MFDLARGSQGRGQTKFGELDRTAREILRALQAEGRISNVALAEKVPLSPAACFERVRLLTEQGCIRGYQALLHPVALPVR